MTNEKKNIDELREAFSRCINMNDKARRDAVISGLPQDIKQNIKRGDTDLIDVQYIIETCNQYPKGINELYAILKRKEGTSKGIKSVEKILQKTINPPDISSSPKKEVIQHDKAEKKNNSDQFTKTDSFYEPDNKQIITEKPNPMPHPQENKKLEKEDTSVAPLLTTPKPEPNDNIPESSIKFVIAIIAIIGSIITIGITELYKNHFIIASIVSIIIILIGFYSIYKILDKSKKIKKVKKPRLLLIIFFILALIAFWQIWQGSCKKISFKYSITFISITKEKEQLLTNTTIKIVLIKEDSLFVNDKTNSQGIGEFSIPIKYKNERVKLKLIQINHKNNYEYELPPALNIELKPEQKSIQKIYIQRIK